MPNGMINATKWNDTLYDIHDKRISDNDITDWDGKYEKPQAGIPSTDMSNDVQTLLNKADTALQSAPVTSVNSKTGAVTLSYSDVGADASGAASVVADNLIAHTGDTDIHVTTNNKSTWNAKYDKPSGGIPKSDLTSSAQASLDKADSAVQSVNGQSGSSVTISIPSTLADLSGDSTHRVVTDTEISAWGAKYDKPSGGIPKTDLTSTVQTSLGKADTALQSVPSGYATETYVNSAIATATPTSGTLTLLATTGSWTDEQDGTYSQQISITGGTANTKVDLQVSVSVIEQMQTDKVTALYVVNNSGVFTMIAVGAEPSAAMTIQYTRTEVVVSS